MSIWEKLGLILFILGCFGMLQVTLGINEPLWGIPAAIAILSGILLFLVPIGNKK